MKVCDVVLNSIWYDPRVRKQLVEYKAQGIDICAVGQRCSRYDESKLGQIPCRANIVQIDSRFEGYQRSIFRKLKRQWLRFRGVRDAIVAEAPDIIHANDLDALLPAYSAARKLKCKIIYDSHEVYVENNLLQGRPLWAWIMKQVERYLVRRVDLMVCVSHAAADYFAKTYKIKTPMVVTNCSLQSEQCVAEKKNPGFEVLNHGQYYAGRGYDVMVEAAQYLKEYPQIKMAMRGFGAMEQQLRDRAEELKAENVIFYPKVLVEELIPYASLSMVGVAMTQPICLNFELSVSNKLFEYASAGLPVIMSDIPEHKYLNEKYRFGIVLEEDSPETLAKAVIRLYEDKALYGILAANAQIMSAEVNWETEFGALIELEKNMLKAEL